MFFLAYCYIHAKAVCAGSPVGGAPNNFLITLLNLQLQRYGGPQENVYLDDFSSFGVLAPAPSDSTGSSALQAEIDKLTEINRGLLRRLVDYELSS